MLQICNTGYRLQLWLQHKKKKQCLNVQKQIISMQIEFENTTKLNYYSHDTQKEFSKIDEWCWLETTSCKIGTSTHFVVVKIYNHWPLLQSKRGFQNSKA